MYKSYTIYEPTGNILVSGEVPADIIDKQLQAYHIHGHPEALLIEQASDPLTDIVDTVNKIVLKGQKPQNIPRPAVKTYDQSRVELYPPINEQLDMLWHSMDRGEIPKAEPFYTYIKTIKSAYPKDNSIPTNSVSVNSVDPVP